MMKFTMKDAASIRLCSHQTKLKKYEGKRSEQAQVTAFSGFVARKYRVLHRRAFRISYPPIESGGRFTRLTVRQTSLCPIDILAKLGAGRFTRRDRPGRLANRPIL